jgi:hypothetical protein
VNAKSLIVIVVAIVDGPALWLDIPVEEVGVVAVAVSDGELHDAVSPTASRHPAATRQVRLWRMAIGTGAPGGQRWGTTVIRNRTARRMGRQP